MVDVNLLLRNYLLSQTSVTNLLGTNRNGSIYASTAIPEGIDAALGPFIQLFRSGGKSHPEIISLIYPRVQIRAWADVGKNKLAADVWAAIYDVLHGATRIVLADGVIMGAELDSGPQEMPPDEDNKWASVNGFFIVMARPN